MICGISEKQILIEIDEKEIFKIICKIKNIDYEEIVENLIQKIKESNIEDKEYYISEQETWDSEYIHIIKEEDVLNICDELLWNKKEAIKFFKEDYGDKTEKILEELWIETNEKEKEVIKIAKKCNANEIRIEAMR
ncbi:MAG: hypothetical protein J6A04_02275 [Clostridia bacterium]|nr:hypothetical protein [Clostridia bacterium]